MQGLYEIQAHLTFYFPFLPHIDKNTIQRSRARLWPNLCSWQQTNFKSSWNGWWSHPSQGIFAKTLYRAVSSTLCCRTTISWGKRKTSPGKQRSVCLIKTIRRVCSHSSTFSTCSYGSHSANNDLRTFSVRDFATMFITILLYNSVIQLCYTQWLFKIYTIYSYICTIAYNTMN